MEVKREDQLKILNWVNSVIGAEFGREEEAPPGVLKILPPCGAFVTLHLNDRLRGCIGFIEGREPLAGSLKDAARSAAFRDPRFPPLREEEWRNMDLEISLLSPLEELDSPGKLNMGEHGALMESGLSRGLFLPQVAVEQGWDRDTFMDHLCAKAGLPMDFWHKGSYTLFRFTALIFSFDE